MCSQFILSAMLTPLKEELQGRMWERFAFWGSFQLIFRRATSKPCVICMQQKPEGRLRSSNPSFPYFGGLGFHRKSKCLHFLIWHLSKRYVGDVCRAASPLAQKGSKTQVTLGGTDIQDGCSVDESSQGKRFVVRSANRWIDTMSSRTSSICNKK